MTDLSFESIKARIEIIGRHFQLNREDKIFKNLAETYSKKQKNLSISYTVDTLFSLHPQRNGTIPFFEFCVISSFLKESYSFIFYKIFLESIHIRSKVSPVPLLRFSTEMKSI